MDRLRLLAVKPWRFLGLNRHGQLTGRRWWIGAAAAGVLAGLALPPWGCPAALARPGAALGPAGLLGGLGGWVWGAAAVLVSHRWLLWLHPLDWVGVPLPLSLPLCLLLWACAWLGPCWWPCGWLS